MVSTGDGIRAWLSVQFGRVTPRVYDIDHGEQYLVVGNIQPQRVLGGRGRFNRVWML